MAQISKVVNFSDLTEQEKEQYINFVMKNNIDFVEDEEEEDRYVARIRIKPDATSNRPTPTKQMKRSSRQKSQFSTVNSRQNLDSASSFQSVSSKQSLRDLNVQQKENRKTPFVLASAQNVEKPVNKITADYMSFRNKSPVDSLSTFETQNENKSLFELMENIDISRDHQNKVNNGAASMNSIKSGGSNTRSKSSQPIRDKETSAAASTRKNTSMIDEYLSGCIEEYKTFSRLLDLENMGSYNRPKKLSLDALSKLIEEILTARFTKETNLLKANLSRGDSTNRSYLSRQRNSSLPYFIYEFLREKNKGIKNYHQSVGLSLAYSTLLYRRKNERVNLFSKFLSEQNDSEDLTFFLFARSLVEKELAIVLTNKNLSSDGALLTQKNCYRILEAVYGKDEKQLINRVFRKIKEQIEWEKEVNIGPDVNKINMYSFLKILLDDYHSSRLSIAEHTFEDDQDTQSIESGTFHQLEDLKMSEKRRGSMQEKITQEEIKDEIDRYLFSQPTENPTVASTESLPKALNDITNQTNTVQISQHQGNLFSNIHNSWYNNPNNHNRNQMYGQFKDNSFETDNSPQNDNFNSNYLVNTDSARHNSLASLQSRKNTNPAILSKNVSNSRLAAGSVLSKYLEPESSYSTEQKDVPVANFAQHPQAGNRFANNTKAHPNSRSNNYSDLHRKSNSSLDGQQTSYAQLNYKKMNNTRNNSINESNTNYESGHGLNTSYSSCHNSKQSLIPKDKVELERSMEKLNPALSLKDKFASIEKNEVAIENFSFRNSDIKVVHPSHHVASPEDTSRSDADQTLSVNHSRVQTNQTNNTNSQRSFIRNENQCQELKDYCLMVMTSKVHDFIEAMLFEGQEEKNSDEQKIMNGLMDLFDRKFKTLLDALFSFDKLKWLSSLMIEDPDSKQLQNVEELQKELRGLQRRNFDELDEGDIEVFANKIFRTPELSTQIGRLIVEFTLPQDLLYEDDS